MMNAIEKVIEAMNSEFEKVDHTDTKAQDAIYAKYDPLLEAAEKEFEAEVDKEFAEADALLEKEREEFEAELKAQNDASEKEREEREAEQQKEIDEIIKNQELKEEQIDKDAEMQRIRKQYTVKELKAIAKEKGITVPSKLREVEIIELLLSKNVEL